MGLLFNMSKKERLVAAIENGTVIDHIPAEKTFQVVNLLQLQKLSTPVTIGYNFSSKMVGTKGIIKVSDKFFTDDEISRLSVVAPNVVLNIINATTQSASQTTNRWTRFSTLLTKRTEFSSAITATRSRRWTRWNLCSPIREKKSSG